MENGLRYLFPEFSEGGGASKPAARKGWWHSACTARAGRLCAAHTATFPVLACCCCNPYARRLHYPGLCSPLTPTHRPHRLCSDCVSFAWAYLPPAICLPDVQLPFATFARSLHSYCLRSPPTCTPLALLLLAFAVQSPAARLLAICIYSTPRRNAFATCSAWPET